MLSQPGSDSRIRCSSLIVPVILEPGDWPTWLGEVEGDPTTLLGPSAYDVLRVWAVSRSVNSPRNNSAELLEAVG